MDRASQHPQRHYTPPQVTTYHDPRHRIAGDRLTESQVNMLDLLAAGVSNAGIAASLGYSLRTVEDMITRAYAHYHIEGAPGASYRRVQLANAYINDVTITCLFGEAV